MQAYIKIDQRIHFLCQLIAKANRTYVPAMADDSHTNLAYDALGRRLMGRWALGEGRYLLGFNLRDMTMEWLDPTQRSVQTFELVGKTMAELEQAVMEQLPDLGLDPQGFADDLHYQIVEYDFHKMPIEPLEKEGLREWRYFRSQANYFAQAVLDYFQSSGEVRIWPHHFDTGVYLQVKEHLGIGFGLAMADAMIASPYYYLAGYSSDMPFNYDDLPDMKYGIWELNEHWQGAVLDLSHISGKSWKKQQRGIRDLIQKAIGFYLDQ